MAGFGLQIARSQGMEGYTGNFTEFNINPTDANAIFSGDPVIMNGGFVEEFSGNVAGPVTPSVPIVGVFHGCRYRAANGDYEYRNYWDGAAGRSEVVAHIALPMHSTFYIKGDSTVSFTQADVGQRHELAYQAGNAQYGDSRVVMNQLAPTTGSVMLHRLAPLPGNAWTSAEPVFEVSVVLQSMTASDAA